MLGIGPILWREANRIMHGNPLASGADPVSRSEAMVIDNSGTYNPRYRYQSPAAWYYYQCLDEINKHIAVPTEAANE